MQVSYARMHLCTTWVPPAWLAALAAAQEAPGLCQAPGLKCPCIAAVTQVLFARMRPRMAPGVDATYLADRGGEDEMSDAAPRTLQK